MELGCYFGRVIHSRQVAQVGQEFFIGALQSGIFGMS
jgi:hypothetical protein